MVNKALASSLSFIFEDEEDIVESIHKRQTLQMTNGEQEELPLRDVVVTSDQLKHFRDTLVRADASFLSAKNRCLELARTLHLEQVQVRDAIQTVDRLARTGL